ncbi:MAG: CRISPR-associated protein Cas5, partial [Roseiflexaceae bacterium]|nr:CRISPR-associated protein Cas5 [Roseiflexaceae bacterium]
MTIWVIEPHDPLIMRDGRPFNPTPGARAVSLPFPLPSTVIGALRTRAGSDANGNFDQTRVLDMLTQAMHGPFLVEIGQDDQLAWLMPAPADALITKDDSRCRPLVPFTICPDEQTDLQQLAMLVAPEDPTPAKVDPQAVRFWRWSHFSAWLMQPKAMPIPTDLGIGELLINKRVHVRVSAESQTADEGGLFITHGLEFTTEKQGYSLAVKRLGLALATDAAIQPGLGTLGGERRMIA